MKVEALAVGDEVAVLRACRLPKVEEVLGVGRIERAEGGRYWVSGFPIARDARVLRRLAPLVERCHGDDVRKVVETHEYIVNGHPSSPISHVYYECPECGRRLKGVS